MSGKLVYIDSVEQALNEAYGEGNPLRIGIILKNVSAVDAVAADKVAQMFFDLTGDDCPCNYVGVDEWLPEVCDLQSECPHPKDLLGCWKQFVKHYRSEKMDGGEKKNE